MRQIRKTRRWSSPPDSSWVFVTANRLRKGLHCSMFWEQNPRIWIGVYVWIVRRDASCFSALIECSLALRKVCLLEQDDACFVRGTKWSSWDDGPSRKTPRQVIGKLLQRERSFPAMMKVWK